MAEINSKEYWDDRFGSGDWERKGGRGQTKAFAESQVKYFDIPGDFSGTILDFGCGLGDSIPVYRQTYPSAKLIGVDFSEKAIKICRDRYSGIAGFLCGDHLSVPEADVIIASNVFEHLGNDLEIASSLKNRCKKLIIIVPYKDMPVHGEEHINRYDRNSFAILNPVSVQIFKSQGWTQSGFNLWFHTRLKNIGRFMLGIPVRKVRKQIMFTIC
jgi:SAM-dependent methyltransferase